MIWMATAVRKRRILIDVDTQSHFFQNRSPVCIHNPQTVLDNIEKVIQWAHECHMPMVSTIQVHVSHAVYTRTHQMCRLTTQKPMCTMFPSHLDLRASDTMDWSSEAWQQYDQVIIQKRSFDPFEEPRADRILTELPADECIIIGTPVEGAVKATALGLLLRQKEVTIVSDAVGELDENLGRKAWEHLHSKSIRFVDTKKLLKTSVHAPIPFLH